MIHDPASRTPPRNGDSGLCISPGPLKGPLLAKARRDPRHGAQKEGCHDRRLQQGLGSAVRGQTDLRPMVRRGVGPAHQLPRNVSSVSGLSILPAGRSGTPRANTFRQMCLDVSVVLSFLQEILDKQRSSSTIKVLSGNHSGFPCPYCWPIGGQR